MAIRKSTIDKIRNIEAKYGSLINAYESTIITFNIFKI
jgi:hypothetical protein